MRHSFSKTSKINAAVINPINIDTNKNNLARFKGLEILNKTVNKMKVESKMTKLETVSNCFEIGSLG
ncbi:hypothetical protein ACEW7V_02210 [Areca yellow leaf disease phytoplasma]|uniref:hypothetical protein n=1 Tax=Areca yellow leaf disease phytoplasma TaxID=927614 RepID=UPI0035B562F6